MMKKALLRLHKGEKGFTLFELLIAMAIGSIVGAGITATIVQVINTNARSTNHMVAVREAQNVGYWVSHDAQMAQGPYSDVLPATPGDYFLRFHWVEWPEEIDDPDISLVVTYSFDGTKLVRSEVQTINGVTQPAVDLTVAEHIKHDTGDPDDSIASFDVPSSVLTLTVTAAVGGGSQEVSETREYQVKPRPSA